MILSYSGRLLHTVEPWESMHQNLVPKDLREQGVTPGRVSMVFMCPEETYQLCKGMAADWGTKEGFGMTRGMATGAEERDRQKLRRDEKGKGVEKLLVDAEEDSEEDFIYLLDYEEEG